MVGGGHTHTASFFTRVWRKPSAFARFSRISSSRLLRLVRIVRASLAMGWYRFGSQMETGRKAGDPEMGYSPDSLAQEVSDL
jgi:hypothetical protein